MRTEKSTFYYADEITEKLIPYFGEFLLDSGAFTFMMSSKKNLNDIFDFNPTAENIAKWICDELGEKCYKVTVQESEGNIAEYERD